ncbi:MAG: helix-turn-helix domain-containing protein [Leptospirillum sp.]
MSVVLKTEVVVVGELLNSEQAASFLGVRPQTLACWRLYGRGPAFAKIGRLVRYDRLTLENWVRKNTVTGEAV